MLSKKTIFALVAATGREINPNEQDDIISIAYDQAAQPRPSDHLYDPEIIGAFLNIPLNIHIDSMQRNYMRVSATRQWMLVNYVLNQFKNENLKVLSIPEPMSSILDDDDKLMIHVEWSRIHRTKLEQRKIEIK